MALLLPGHLISLSLNNQEKPFMKPACDCLSIPQRPATDIPSAFAVSASASRSSMCSDPGQLLPFSLTETTHTPAFFLKYTHIVTPP